MCSSPNVSALRQELSLTLGANYSRYMEVMRDWFGNKHNRQDWEFDMPFLTGRSREIHNQLMVAILKLCMSPHFDGRSPVRTSVAPVVSQSHSTTQVLLTNGKPQDHVITLHAAPPHESPRMDMYMDQTVTPILAPSLPMTLGEEDEEGDEEGTLDESKVKPLFIMGLRKTRVDEVDEHLLPSLQKVDRRMPSSFLKDLVGSREEDFRDLIPNVTHTLNVTKELGTEPELSKYFRSRLTGGPFLTSEGSVPGKFLLGAWKHGIPSINPEVFRIASKAAEERVVNLVRELIKQRKSFRMKAKGQVQFGEPHGNPYILSRHHIPTPTAAERRPYSTILVEPITLPPDTELQEKSEQLAALRGATSMDTSPEGGQFPPRIGMMELFLLAKAKPHLFPNWDERTRLLESALLHPTGGFFQPPSPDSTLGEEEYEEEGELLPMVSY